MPLSRTQRLLSEALRQLPELTVKDWRRTALVRLDVLAETYGDLLDHADPNVRLRVAKGMASVERDRAELFAGGGASTPVTAHTWDRSLPGDTRCSPTASSRTSLTARQRCVD